MVSNFTQALREVIGLPGNQDLEYIVSAFVLIFILNGICMVAGSLFKRKGD